MEEEIKEQVSSGIEQLERELYDLYQKNDSNVHLQASRKILRFGFRMFVQGVDFQKNEVWRDRSEEPERDRQILIENINGSFSSDNFYTTEWQTMVKRKMIVRWAYVEDIKPINEED